MSALKGVWLIAGCLMPALTTSAQDKLNGPVVLPFTQGEVLQPALAAPAGPRLVVQSGWGGSDFLCLSADGKLALTRCDLAATRLWEIESGREIRRFDGLGGKFSTDGRSVFTVNGIGEFRKVRRWDVRTGKGEVLYQGATRFLVGSITLAPDGRRFAVCSAGGKINAERAVVLCDTRTGNELWRTRNSRAYLTMFSPDGSLLFEVSRDRVVWSDVESGKQLIDSCATNATYLTGVKASSIFR